MSMSDQGYRSFRLTLGSRPWANTTQQPQLYVSKLVEVPGGVEVRFSDNRNKALVRTDYEKAFVLFRALPVGWQEHIVITPSKED